MDRLLTLMTRFEQNSTICEAVTLLFSTMTFHEAVSGAMGSPGLFHALVIALRQPGTPMEYASHALTNLSAEGREFHNLLRFVLLSF